MRPRQHVRAVIDQDGAVLLDLKKGKYFAINDVAADIWRAIEAGLHLPEIERQLCEHYEVDAATAHAHLAVFVEGLMRDGLLEHD